MFDEADYICFLAKSISLGLYQSGGFYVVPEFISNKKAVYFPNLNYSPKFWKLIKKCKSKNLGDSYPTEALKEITSKIMPKKSKVLKKDGLEIELLNTDYGTSGSYFVKKKKIGTYKVYMTQRTDNTKVDFERTLLLAKLKIKNKDLAEIGSVNWHKRNGVAEYFFGKPSNLVSDDLILKSNKYLKKLGFYDNKLLSNLNLKEFTLQETNLLQYLRDNESKIVSFDKTAEILWKNNSYDKYSPQAMAKVIENMRNKIRGLGINKEVIFTKRGRGYIFQT